VTCRFQGPLFEALSKADAVGVGPIHRAERLPESEILDRDLLCSELGAAGVDACCVQSVAEFIPWLASNTQPGDLVLLLSNGAFGGLRERICAELPEASIELPAES